ncbi:MAG TPA: hypothetical protein DEQ47_05465 [Solibacterales bacterium]|nr:hypothetical protein [Bryobacterales bacterium]
MRFSILLLACAMPVCGAKTDWPTGNRITPPVIASVSPQGVARGAMVEMTIEGLNLANATHVYFNRPGVTARILRTKELPDVEDVRLGSNGGVSTVDLGPLPPRHQVTLEVEVAPDALVGPVDLRLQTPLGTTTMGRFLVEPYYGESPDREPNNTAEEAFETFLPTILAGAISKPGDVDYFKVTGRAGEEVVFEDAARSLGSKLDLTLQIFDQDQKLLQHFHEDGSRPVNAWAYKFPKNGAYFLRISDAQEGGSAKHSYRIRAGKLPLVISHYPLGLREGSEASIALNGYNLHSNKVTLTGKPTWDDPLGVTYRAPAASGLAFDEVKLALGHDPEIEAEAREGQMLKAPVTVNGKLTAAHHDFRFHAAKGEQVLVDVMAARLGSRLDSLLEVLDSAGKPIERATVRAVLETSTTLSDRDSASRGIRLNQLAQLGVSDYLMIGGEIDRIEAQPRGPDDDYLMTGFNGQRLTYFDTTAEAHAVDKPVYKVQILPPGAKVASNGLPVVHLTYRNDDGGPGYGKDSRLHFTAPADGEYIVRLSDVRGLSGEDFPYRLSLRHAEPDYRLAVAPRNPNVPAGGRIPLTVTAVRMDDFDGPIPVSLDKLPAGLHATSAVIEPGQTSTTLILSADANAKLDEAVPLVVTDGKGHVANPEDRLKLIALMPAADIQMTAAQQEVVLEPGQRAKVQVSIERQNGFAGRVPVEVLNLPPNVRVTDVGLNGVLINETESQRSFTLEALPIAEPVEQPLVLAGAIETRAGGQQNAFASAPIKLRIKASEKKQLSMKD